MLATLPIVLFLGAVAAKRNSGDPPPGNWWSVDCYSKNVHWFEPNKDNPDKLDTYWREPRDQLRYDWELTRNVCRGSFSNDAEYQNGRCVASTPGYSINGRNWWAACADKAKQGFSGFTDKGLVDPNRTYYGIAEGRGYLPGQ